MTSGMAARQAAGRGGRGMRLQGEGLDAQLCTCKQASPGPACASWAVLPCTWLYSNLMICCQRGGASVTTFTERGVGLFFSLLYSTVV